MTRQRETGRTMTAGEKQETRPEVETLELWNEDEIVGKVEKEETLFNELRYIPWSHLYPSCPASSYPHPDPHPIRDQSQC